MVPPSFRPEGSILPDDVPEHFERFYRASIRRVVGRRLRSSDVFEAYHAWASANDASSISYQQLRRYMRAIGHDRTKSNGIRYLDAAFVADAPNAPDCFRILPLAERMPAGALDEALTAIDTATAALRQVRDALTGPSS